MPDRRTHSEQGSRLNLGLFTMSKDADTDKPDPDPELETGPAPAVGSTAGQRIVLGLGVMLFIFVVSRVLIETDLLKFYSHPHGLSLRAIFGWLLAWAFAWPFMRLFVVAWRNADREDLGHPQRAAIWAGISVAMLLMMQGG